tara:strand:- start:692 stop:1168 length:477 start_codon:yes stop_codon:yes gene_type:complete
MLTRLPDEAVALVAAHMHARDVDATVAIVHASGDVRTISQHMGFDTGSSIELKKAILRSEQARLYRHASEWPSTRRCTRFTETSEWASPGLIVRDSELCPWVITKIIDDARVCIRPLHHAATETCVRAWDVQSRSGKRYVLSIGAFVTGERFVLHALA